MEFIKVEILDMGDPAPCRVKSEDTEEQRDLIGVKDESQEPSEDEAKHQYQNPHNVTTGENALTKIYFICPQCGRSFTQQHHLKDHMRIHTRERPFTCPQCGKSFTQQGQLKRHVRIHTGEKPFTCPQCGKSFTQAQSLKIHVHVHSGEMPFNCEQCGQKFVLASHLQRHIRTHTTRGPTHALFVERVLNASVILKSTK
ncbi:gastrula zinc finger protein XlCGF49.1-like [Xyrauchen texanus]|uniref:gastrula zinc finger protein XlCGF49.1-like n=1 Tax=Xyrauchen texanus TaxID=154827 RepID=UPI002241B00E|nr:gastrula zinc finger protein XlCGF49.1-like [Xyrauchen texanus]